MGRKTFTDEQIERLRQNPYTYSVTRLRLAFTKEFKGIFYSEYQAGELPRKILEDHGYAPRSLGNAGCGGSPVISGNSTKNTAGSTKARQNPGRKRKPPCPMSCRYQKRRN